MWNPLPACNRPYPLLRMNLLVTASYYHNSLRSFLAHVNVKLSLENIKQLLDLISQKDISKIILVVVFTNNVCVIMARFILCVCCWLQYVILFVVLK